MINPCNLLPRAARLLFISTIIALSGINIAHAEPLETISVTASRTAIDSKDVGSSITILDKKFIEQSNAISLADLLRAVPGLQVSQQGSRGAVTQVRVRGAEANQILVLIDGIEANDLSQGSEFNFAHLMTASISRVEIVRGPQSVLWGSDALAGVINVTTLEHGDNSSQVSITAEAGSNNSQALGLGWRFKDDKSEVNFNANSFDTDGTNISRIGKEKDGYENQSINLAGRYLATDTLVVTGAMTYVDARTEFDAIDFVTTGLPVDDDNVTNSKQIYGKFGLEKDSFDGKFFQRFSYTRTDTDNETDTGGATNDITRGLKEQYQYQGDIRATKQILSLVAEYEKEDYTQRGLALPFGDPNKDLELDTRSLALEYRFNNEDWDFSASVRRDDNSDFKNSTSYRVTGNWHTPIENLDTFASLGSAIKNPTFTDRFGFFDNFIGNPNLKPERSDAWEVGIRHAALNGTLATSLSYFQSVLDDEIDGFVFDPVTFGFTAANRTTESNRQGVEAEINWRHEFFSLRTSYTYIDSTFEDSTGKNIREVRRPKHMASIVADYQWQRANLNISVIYTGQQQDDFFPPFPLPQTRVKLGSYTLVNLAGSFKLANKIQLTARLDNLFDKDYEEVYGFNSPGFTAYTGVRFNW